MPEFFFSCTPVEHESGEDMKKKEGERMRLKQEVLPLGGLERLRNVVTSRGLINTENRIPSGGDSPKCHS